MAGKTDEDGEKHLEPTVRKLEEARRKGEIARSADLTTAASYGGLLLAAAMAGGASLSEIANRLTWFLAQADMVSLLVFTGSAPSSFNAMAFEIILYLAPWFLLPAGLALATVLAQRSFILTPSRISPKLSRISPLANAGQKFGRSGLFEFIKNLIKLLIYCAVLWFFLRARLDALMQTIWMSPQIAMLLLFELCLAFLLVVFVVALVIGFADFLWQKQDHLRKNRMSHKEMKDESKETEGNPEQKQERRRRAYEIATNRMMQDVPTADVIIVNPTHYAIALKWSRKPGEAPVCVAKGLDEIALRIRELAQENGVPIHNDPPVARALFSTTNIGDEIGSIHYRAVAAAIRFADRMPRKRGRGQ
jgi:flagellar biosynthesis protein FlhB